MAWDKRSNVEWRKEESAHIVVDREWKIVKKGEKKLETYIKSIVWIPYT